MKSLSVAVSAVIAITVLGCGPDTGEQHLQGFISAHVEKIKPMAKEMHLAYWAAANSGRKCRHPCR